MKKMPVIFILLSLVLSPLFYSCEKEDNNGSAPELPSVSSMEMDYSFFLVTKSGWMEANSQENFVTAVANVTIWNILASVVTIVPVTAFGESFNHEATFLGDATWKWEYEVPYLGNTISAKLEAQVLTDSAEWRMYLSYDGEPSFENYLWFKGRSALDKSGGWWVLYEGNNSVGELLKIDWTYDSEDIGSLKYSYVKQDHEDYGNYIMFEKFVLNEDNFDRRYTILDVAENKSAVIEWNSETTEGRINKFNEDAWGCWDASHNDLECN